MDGVRHEIREAGFDVTPVAMVSQSVAAVRDSYQKKR